ncbi:MAG: hypothetical protein AAFP93_00410 [Bacteroidota bacterium]
MKIRKALLLLPSLGLQACLSGNDHTLTAQVSEKSNDKKSTLPVAEAAPSPSQIIQASSARHEHRSESKQAPPEVSTASTTPQQGAPSVNVSASQQSTADARRVSLTEAVTFIHSSQAHNPEMLVKALNDSKDEYRDGLLRIFRDYNTLFLSQPFTTLRKKDIADYSLIGKVRVKVEPKDDTRRLIRKCVEVWRNKIEEGLDIENFAAGVAQFLQYIDHEAFDGDPTLLTKLGISLLDRLPKNKDHYTQSTYPSHKDILNALHHTLLKIRNISGDKLRPNDKDGLYQRFNERLSIIEKSAYFPFSYQAQLVQQGLVLLRGKFEPSHPTWRVYYGAKGILQVAQSIKSAALLDFDFENFEEGISNIIGAVVGDIDSPNGNVKDAVKLVSKRLQRLKIAPWCGQAQELFGQALRCVAINTVDIKVNEDAFYKYRRGLDKVRKTLPKNKKEHPYLYYSIARQLTMIGLKGPETVGKLCLHDLEELLKDEKWVKHEAVLRELLASLATIATQHKNQEISARAEDILLKIEKQLLSPGTPRPRRSQRTWQIMVQACWGQEAVKAKLKRMREVYTQLKQSREQQATLYPRLVNELVQGGNKEPSSPFLMTPTTGNSDWAPKNVALASPQRGSHTLNQVNIGRHASSAGQAISPAEIINMVHQVRAQANDNSRDVMEMVTTNQNIRIAEVRADIQRLDQKTLTKADLREVFREVLPQQIADDKQLQAKFTEQKTSIDAHAARLTQLEERYRALQTETQNNFTAIQESMERTSPELKSKSKEIIEKDKQLVNKYYKKGLKHINTARQNYRLREFEDTVRYCKKALIDFKDARDTLKDALKVARKFGHRTLVTPLAQSQAGLEKWITDLEQAFAQLEASTSNRSLDTNHGRESNTRENVTLLITDCNQEDLITNIP